MVKRAGRGGGLYPQDRPWYGKPDVAETTAWLTTRGRAANLVGLPNLSLHWTVECVILQTWTGQIDTSETR